MVLPRAPGREQRAPRGASLAAVLLALFSSHCGDGTVRPFHADSAAFGGSTFGGSRAGGARSTTLATGGLGGMSLSSVAAGGTGSVAGASSTDPDCAISDWPDAALEDDMLAQLNVLRTSGVTCGWGSTFPAQPLVDSDSLRCAARVHSMTAFGFEIVEQPTEAVTFYSPPTEQLDLSSLLFDVIMTGGTDCYSLLDPGYTTVGVGFSSDGLVGYWTFYLAFSP